jgi:hypothetical protein
MTGADRAAPNKTMAALLAIPTAVPRVVTGYTLCPLSAVSVRSVGRAYFVSTKPGRAWTSCIEAQADLQAAIDGAFGILLPQACLAFTRASK